MKSYKIERSYDVVDDMRTFVIRFNHMTGEDNARISNGVYVTSVMDHGAEVKCEINDDLMESVVVDCFEHLDDIDEMRDAQI